jgi:hypothetical protein
VLRTLPVAKNFRMSSRHLCTVVISAVLAALAGCATTPAPEPVPPPPPPKATTPAAPPKAPAPKPYVEPPPPPVNLQGFPPTYRLGFGDGCATARGTDTKDAARFAGDGNYRTGWQDGVAQCKKK